MALQVNGKTALVTGGGSGICLEFTKILIANGCNVVVADLALSPEAQGLVNGRAGAKAKAHFQKTDVTDWTQLGAAFATAIKEFGRLDIVCPGAGIFEPVRLITR
jgi:NAD(P)-dependent dehydrogenase (short-subunit alcohol dehydrogenase family)